MPTVQCAQIFWTPASSLFEYQCAFCEELFIKHEDCLSHVTECQQNKTAQINGEIINLSIEDPMQDDCKNESNPPEIDYTEKQFEYVPVYPEKYLINDDTELLTETPYEVEYLDEDDHDSGPISSNISDKKIQNQSKTNYQPKKKCVSTSGSNSSVSLKEYKTKPGGKAFNQLYTAAKSTNLNGSKSESLINEEDEFSSLLLMHLGQKLKCEICDLERATRKGMLSHMENYHEANPSVLQCPSCPKVFKSASKLSTHQYSHNARFSCEFCGNTFNFKSNLKKHMRIHTKEKPYTCTICNTHFTVSNSLSYHMKVHRNERPFACPDCPMKFVLKTHLRQHSNVHTRATKLSCDNCDKVFSHRQSLLLHQSTHTGERRYECKLCDRKFARPDALKIHMNMHTGNSPFGCRLCDRRFHSSAARRSHEKSVHKIQ